MTTRVVLAAAGSQLTVAPPLGLLAIAAAVRGAGADVQLFDLTVRPDRRDAFLRACEDPAVLWAGFSSFTPSLPATVRLAEEARARRADLPLVLGGVHATALPRRTLLEGPWDAVCVGEGEDAAARLTARLREGGPTAGPGLLSRDHPGAAVERVVADVAALPLPAWDLVDLRDYQDRPWQLVRRGRRVAPLMTTRGCPFACSFCAVHAVCGSRLRLRPVERVLEEAELLVRVHGADELHVFDDAFNVDLDHAKGVLDGLLGRGIRIPWKTPNGIRVDLWDREFVQLVRRSGGYQVGFGLESADPEVLRRNRKQIDPAAALDAIAAWESAGISTFGFFIIGLPGETEESIRRTREFARRSALTHVHASFAIPYPGSALYDARSEAQRVREDWGCYRHTHPFPTCGLPAAALRAHLRAFYLRFYASPRRAARLAVECLRSGPLAFARTGWSYWSGTAAG